MTAVFQLASDDGSRLDARIEIEGPMIVLQARGGARGKNPINPAYNDALLLLLQRLRDSGSRIEGAWVDSSSKRVRALSLCEREVLSSADGALSPVNALGVMKNRMRKVGREPGATGPGNATRRVRLQVSGTRTTEQLASILRAKPVSPRSGWPAATPGDQRRALPLPETARSNGARQSRKLPPTYLSQTDRDGYRVVRGEQRKLREWLLEDQAVGACCICGRTLPKRFLWASHLKKRGACTAEERVDVNVVALMCKLGCDDLYEHGDIYVVDGVIHAHARAVAVSALETVLRALTGRWCEAFSPASRPYFEWHAAWALAHGDRSNALDDLD